MKILLMVVLFSYILTEITGLTFLVSSIVLNGGGLPYEYRKTAPAIEMALEALNKTFPSFELTFDYRDYGSVCTDRYVGAIAAEIYYTKKVAAFLGPGMYSVHY